jgi:hypothetical protein
MASLFFDLQLSNTDQLAVIRKAAISVKARKKAPLNQRHEPRGRTGHPARPIGSGNHDGEVTEGKGAKFATVLADPSEQSLCT